MKNKLCLKPLTIKKDIEYANKSTSTKIITDEIDKLTSIDKKKLKFNIDNLSSDFEYHGLKIIVCDNPDIFVRNILNNNESYSRICIDENLVRNKNIFHIHPFSKISDFINNKSNGLLHEYLKSKDIESNNKEFEEFIGQKYYQFDDKYLESITDINLEKASILDYIEVSKEYLDSDNIKSLLNIIKGSDKNKQLIIINDYRILDIESIIVDYIDHFNFLVITNDLKRWINDFKYLECLVIINEFVNQEFTIDSLEILDKKTLIKYLEKRFKYEKNDNKLYLDKTNIVE